MTNYEKIKAMSIEEIVEDYERILFDEEINEEYICRMCCNSKCRATSESECKAIIREWLESEVD